jgi:hypothetical protein
MTVKCQGTRLRDQILVDGNIFSRFLSVSRFLDTSKWRFGGGGVPYMESILLFSHFMDPNTYPYSYQSCQLRGSPEVSRFGQRS